MCVGGWVYEWMYVWVLECMSRCWGVSALGAFVGVASARMYLCVYPGGAYVLSEGEEGR